MELLTALFENADLPTEFKEKTKTLFEAAVTESTQAELKTLQEAFDTKLKEEKEKFITESTEQFKVTLDEAILEWAKENAQGLDQSAKATLAESFLVDLKTLFEKADIEMGDETASKEIASLTESNTKLIAESEALKVELKEAKDRMDKITMKAIVESATTGLPDTTVSRVNRLCEAFEFKSEDDYKSKVALVVEAVAGIKGTFNTDGSNVAVTNDGSTQAQVNTDAGKAGPENGEFVQKPAGLSNENADGDKGTPSKTQKTPFQVNEGTDLSVVKVEPKKHKDPFMAAALGL